MKVEEYKFGYIKIGNREYRSDVIVYGDKVKTWWRIEGHDVVKEDILEILDEVLDVVVFGSGQAGVMCVSEEVIKELEEKGCKIIVEKTEKAVKIYNDYLDKGKKVAGCFHLTC